MATVKLWDLQRNPNLYTFDAHAGSVSSAVFAPDAAARGDRQHRRHGAPVGRTTGAEIRQFAGPGGYYSHRTRRLTRWAEAC